MLTALLFCEEFIDTGLGINLSGTEFRGGEVGMVGTVGIFLGFEGNRLAEAEGFSCLSRGRSVEKVAAVELKGRLVAPHFESATRGGFIDRGDPFHLIGAFPVDDPVHVVTLAVFQLDIILIDFFADGAGTAEIERSPLDRHDFSRGNQYGVDGCDGASVDREQIVRDRTVTFPFEVEEGVMGDVHHGRFVCCGPIGDFEFIVRGESVCHDDGQVARESLFAVSGRVGEYQPVVGDRIDIPDYAIQSVHSSMKSLSVIVLRKRVGLSLEGERTFGDAVGITSYDGSEETFSVVVDIAIDVLVTQYHIFVFTLPIGGPRGLPHELRSWLPAWSGCRSEACRAIWPFH